MNCTAYEMKATIVCYNAFHEWTKKQAYTGMCARPCTHAQTDLRVLPRCCSPSPRSWPPVVLDYNNSTGNTLAINKGKIRKGSGQLLRYGAVFHQWNAVTANDAWQFSYISYSIKKEVFLDGSFDLVRGVRLGVIPLVRTRFEYYQICSELKTSLCEA